MKKWIKQWMKSQKSRNWMRRKMRGSRGKDFTTGFRRYEADRPKEV